MRNLESGSISFGAFPRSGNHALGKTLSLAFPTREYFWLGHRITKLLTAPNCAVVVRNPLESISSWMQCSYDERVDGADRLIDWYIRYMAGVVAAKGNLIIFRLEHLSANPLDCALRFANRFGLETPAQFRKEDVDNWLSEYMPEHFPNSNSYKKEVRFQSVMSSPRYDEAVKSFNAVLKIAEKAD